MEAPASDGQRIIETLGYLQAHDSVLNCDYAFVAYKETDKAAPGRWRICIKSTQTPGGSFEPEAICNKACEANALGNDQFTWGYSIQPSADDSRHIEFRVHQQNALPIALEMFVILRNADGTPKPPQSVKFAWPGKEFKSSLLMNPTIVISTLTFLHSLLRSWVFPSLLEMC